MESVFQHWRYSIGFVHAHASYTQRRALWAYICALPTAPLLLIGDFNAALGAHERHSSVLPLRTSCQDFQNMISDCQLLEIPMPGGRFTWCGRYIINPEHTNHAHGPSYRHYQTRYRIRAYATYGTFHRYRDFPIYIRTFPSTLEFGSYACLVKALFVTCISYLLL